MKKTKTNDKSSFSGKKTTLSSIPSSTGRHSDPKMKSIAGKAMQGGKFKK